MITMIIYGKENLQILGRPIALSFEDFVENPVKYFPKWDDKTMIYATKEFAEPIIDEISGLLREKTDYEKVVDGTVILADGEYLDDKTKTIKKVEKPNEYSTWDSDKLQWVEDKELKKEWLNKQKYKFQQKYLSLNKQKKELEEEKEEFELLEFDTDETEAKIDEIAKEMESIKKELLVINKEIKKIK